MNIRMTLEALQSGIPDIDLPAYREVVAGLDELAAAVLEDEAARREYAGLDYIDRDDRDTDVVRRIHIRMEFAAVRKAAALNAYNGSR